MHLLSRIPPVVLVLAAIASIQVGAALAKGLFAQLGPGGTVFLRVAFAALVLAVLYRKSLRALPRRDWPLAALFGLVLGAMNLSFYYAVQRLPLGLTVTIEFIGPLSVALWGSRRALDLVWVALAAGGILLLNPLSGALDPVGLGLAVFAGALWAAYIVLGAHLGRRLPGGVGLAASMLVAVLVVAPMGATQALPALQDPGLFIVGFGIALLSSVLPYSLEIEALRRMKESLFGILMSIEPAVAALVGWLLLAEALGVREWLAIALVMAASYGATRYGQHHVPAEPTPEP